MHNEISPRVFYKRRKPNTIKNKIFPTLSVEAKEKRNFAANLD